MDLADPRLKGKVTMPAPGDIGAGGFLLGLAAELGKDYKDPDQMKEVVDWVTTNIGAERPQAHQHSAELQTAAGVGRGRCRGLLERLARLEYFGGDTDIAQVVPAALSHQRLPVDPQGCAAPGAGPDLHQLAAGPGRPVPQRWPIDHGPWAELSEGLLGADYVDHIPDWFKADYYNYYLTLDQIKTGFQSAGLAGLNASAKVVPGLLRPAARAVGSDDPRRSRVRRARGAQASRYQTIARVR